MPSTLGPRPGGIRSGSFFFARTDLRTGSHPGVRAADDDDQADGSRRVCRFHVCLHTPRPDRIGSALIPPEAYRQQTSVTLKRDGISRYQSILKIVVTPPRESWENLPHRCVHL